MLGARETGSRVSDAVDHHEQIRAMAGFGTWPQRPAEISSSWILDRLQLVAVFMHRGFQ